MFDLAEFLKALSDETRLRIMALLFQKEMCVCEICEVIGASQPKVSRHLAKLRDAGLVWDERQGQWVFYKLNIENKTAYEIMSTIVDNISEHTNLNSDRKKIEEKILQCTLCERKGKEFDGQSDRSQ